MVKRAPFPFAPWHMWGSSTVHVATLQAVSPSPFDRQGHVVQLAKINYGRPDTWTFLFGLIASVPPDNAAAVNVLLRADFELIVGVGRSSISLQNGIVDGAGFARLELAYTTPIVQAAPFGTWTTVALTPPLDNATPALQQNIEYFPAQDINCTARIFGTSGAPLLGTEYRVEVHAYFAPRSHIRPDWYDDDNLFRGNETGGT